MAARLFHSARLIACYEGAEDANEAIRLVGALLVRAGAVTQEHVEAAVRRELEYPTGLPSEIPFALVHTDAPGALEMAAALGVFTRPVAFHEMDDRTKTLPVKLVVFLSMPQRHQQAEVLGQLVRLLADATIARRLLTADPAEAKQLLNRQRSMRKAA